MNAHDHGLSDELREWEGGGSYVTVGPHRDQLFVRDRGDADAPPAATLLLVHGYPESSHYYSRCEQRFTERFARVLSVDLLGFGFSDKPVERTYSLFEQADLLLEVWHQQGIRGGHVMSHDMGDTIVTEVLARQTRGLTPSWLPESFESLTFTNGNMVMEEAKLRVGQQVLRSPMGKFLGRIANYPGFARTLRSANGSDALTDDDIKTMWELQQYKQGSAVQYKIIKYLDERDRFQNPRWLPALAATSAPVHFCWAALDAVSPVAVAQYLRTQVRPDATLTVLDGVGHFLHAENPTAVIQAADEFWSSIS